MVKWVLRLQPGSGGPGPAALLAKRLDALGAKPVGRWKASVYLNIKKVPTQGSHETGGSNQVHIVQLHNDCPEKVYVVTKQEDESDIVVEAAVSFMSLWTKIGLYSLKHKMQVEGLAYVLGDFVIRIGSVQFLNNPFRGHMLEVEYAPSVHKSEAQELMREFLEGLVMPDGPVPHAVQYSTRVVSQDYCHEHTALQYVALFKIFSKGQAAPAQPAASSGAAAPPAAQQPQHHLQQQMLHQQAQGQGPPHR